MNPAQLLSHFDRISEATNAIPCLRRFILDLAVRGKLVEQDSRDEAASELLKRIQAEKARLVKEGEIRREQPLPPIGVQELPSESPDNWKWARLGDTSTLITKGSTPTSYGHAFVPSGINFIKVESIKDGQLVSENVTSFISEQTHNFLARSRLAAGDILFSIAGSIGTCARVAPNILPANTNQALAIIRGTNLVFDAEFLLICLKSSIAHLVLAKARGGAMNNVSLDDIRNFVVPIPPLAEQQRIVAKVDELMALCDQLEAAHLERESRRDRLVVSSLNRLNNGAEADVFREYAHFYFNHLPRLTTRHKHIQQLRQTILNLAVRGKLVPQDPNDEPASELLKRIEQAKAQLIAARELRQASSITNSIDRRSEITIPRNWAWAKCDNILFVTKLAGFEYTKHFELCSEGDIPVIRAQNVRPWRIQQNNLLYIDNKTSETLARSALTKPCILVTFIGAGIGDVAFFDEKLRWHLAPNVAKAEVFIGCEDLLDLRYLVLFLNSPFGRAEIFKHMKSTAQPSISMGTIRDIDLALPPFREQERIVTKVDELMALCDRLETQLTTTQTESRRLLEAVLAESFQQNVVLTGG